MLLNSNGGYTIIDPKGVIDDPVMETARFLMNEIPCDDKPCDGKPSHGKPCDGKSSYGWKIYDMVSIMSPIIAIPEVDILKSMYIDAALGHSWTMEEHYKTRQAFDAAKKDVLSTCEFVYGLLG